MVITIAPGPPYDVTMWAYEGREEPSSTESGWGGEGVLSLSLSMMSHHPHQLVGDKEGREGNFTSPNVVSCLINKGPLTQTGMVVNDKGM